MLLIKKQFEGSVFTLWLQRSTRSRYKVSGTVNTETKVNEINIYMIDRA